MKFLFSLFICAALAAAGTGCKKAKKTHVEATDEAGPTLASVVNMSDPRASVQLLKGFHDVEGNAWRWTMGKFTVTLRPPANASTKGATLVVKLNIPEAIMNDVKSTTLTANVNGAPIPGETYTKAGEYVYSKDVPASALGADAVTVEFALDKFRAPGPSDQRELGVVVSSIGFEAK
ncbi:MAG: hypothetical protein ABJF23_08245 [Bryobacteraceae bacterium]